MDLTHLPLSGQFSFEELCDSGFVSAILTGERYADMLQNRITLSLADKHLLESTIFMQDGVPLDFVLITYDIYRYFHLAK